MKRLSTIRNILLLCATVLLGSCDLTETMQVEADKSMVFGSESGLRLYAYSFYRAGVGAGNRVVALAAGVLNAYRIRAVCAVVRRGERGAFRTVEHSAINFDSSKARICFTVIEFRAS